MQDVLETASVCTACAAITGAFIASIAFITNSVLAPAVAQLAMHASSFEILARTVG